MRLLGAVLPLSVEKYRQTIEDRACFDSLYAKCHYRLELDGCEDVGTAGAFYKDAYRHQARILPRLCDIFLAVAGRNEEGAKGGTREAVAAALILRKPVIFLNLDDLRFYFYNNLEEWTYSLKDPVTVPDIVSICTSLFPKEIDWPLDRPKDDMFYRLRRWTWTQYESRFNRRAAADVSGPRQERGQDQFFYRIQTHRKRISEMSKFYMFQYRGGYLLSYCLAIVAVFIAVNTSTVHLVKKELDHISSSVADNSLLLFGFLKVGVILLIIRNTKRVNKREYNAKAIKYRYAAERLRIASYYSLLGMMKIPGPFVGSHVNLHLKTYPGEAIFRKITSQLIIQSRSSLVLDKEYLLRCARFIREDWLQGQWTYYKKDSEKMKAIDSSLISIPEKLSVIVLVIVVAEIIEVLLTDWIDGHFGGVILWLVPLLVGATILLPGVITTLNSVHFQSEARRLAFRDDMMINQIDKVSEQLDAEIKKIESGTGGNCLLGVLTIMDQAAGLTSDEVAEWTMIYEKAVPDAG
jgi:hypothetical protein